MIVIRKQKQFAFGFTSLGKALKGFGNHFGTLGRAENAIAAGKGSARLVKGGMTAEEIAKRAEWGTIGKNALKGIGGIAATGAGVAGVGAIGVGMVGANALNGGMGGNNNSY